MLPHPLLKRMRLMYSQHLIRIDRLFVKLFHPLMLDLLRYLSLFIKRQ